jgi:hypothetical protein
MKKVRKFAEGGFSKAQEEWLGDADRTDPFILARMRDAVPDKAKDTYENNKPYKNEDQGLSKPYVKPEDKTTSVEKTTVKKTPKSLEIKKAVTDINEMPENLRAPNYKVSDSVRLPNKVNIKPKLSQKVASNSSFPSTTFKSGGKVKSASSRADGCAIRGKTRA